MATAVVVVTPNPPRRLAARHSFGFLCSLNRVRLTLTLTPHSYEGVMDVASTSFKKHKVERIIEMASRPRCFAGHGYMVEASLMFLGWSLRKLNVIKPDAEILDPNDLGWRHRPAFTWQQPRYRPSAKAERRAKEALTLARDQLRGNWDR